jgi:predicted methyltransferase
MHFTVEAQRIAASYLSAGSIAIDATAGNGHDTLFLAESVGDSGFVYAMDVQALAIENVNNKLKERRLLHRCQLSLESHANVDKIVSIEHQQKISVAMFNLGYLPFGDKSIVTTKETTLSAIEKIHGMIRPGGLLSLIAYRGHAGGRQEADAVSDWIKSHNDHYRVERYEDAGNDRSPVLWVLTRSNSGRSDALP